ncbi:MAG: glycine/sarcosine/betaine reductase selenoprotein B family protein [Pyrinomonadaceae bacterium]
MTAPSEIKQLRPGLWETVNQRYPGSMITKSATVPLAGLRRPLANSRLTLVSSAGVQPRGTMPFDVVHPIGDLSFRRVPSNSRVTDLEIHQIKYPTDGAAKDLNVIFPIERLQELASDGLIGGLTPNFYSFIGYQMDPDGFESTLAEDLAQAVVADGADAVLMSPA